MSLTDKLKRLKGEWGEHYFGTESHKFYEYAKYVLQENILDPKTLRTDRRFMILYDKFNTYARQISNTLTLGGLAYIFLRDKEEAVYGLVLIAGGELSRVIINYMNKVSKKLTRDMLQEIRKINILEQQLEQEEAWKDYNKHWMR